MRYHLLRYTALNLVVNFLLCTGIGISSKLDFDNPRTSSKLIETVNKYKPTVVYKTNDVGITCVSGGCNTTQTVDQSNSKDSIQTDVVVHVKTNVAVNNTSKTNFEDDTPDIPVIVGSPDPDRPNPNQFLVRPSVDTILNDGVVEITPSPVLPPPNRRPSFVQSKTYQPFPSIPSTEYLPRINIDSFLSEQEGRSGIDTSENVVEIHVPHFEPSYHSHYFGENPPQQVVWFPKTTAPEYKSRAAVKPTIWSLEDLIPTTPKYAGHGTTCTCKKHVDTGLKWYPTSRSHGDPGSQINDKLARLD